MTLLRECRGGCYGQPIRALAPLASEVRAAFAPVRATTQDRRLTWSAQEALAPVDAASSSSGLSDVAAARVFFFGFVDAMNQEQFRAL